MLLEYLGTLLSGNSNLEVKGNERIGTRKDIFINIYVNNLNILMEVLYKNMSNKIMSILFNQPLAFSACSGSLEERAQRFELSEKTDVC